MKRLLLILVLAAVMLAGCKDKKYEAKVQECERLQYQVSGLKEILEESIANTDKLLALQKKDATAIKDCQSAMLDLATENAVLSIENQGLLEDANSLRGQLESVIAEPNVPELKPNIKPIEQQLMSNDPNWVVAYGDTMESQMIYNLAVIRYDQKQIFALIQKLHPKPDPNAVTLESRVKALEDPNYGGFDLW